MPEALDRAAAPTRHTARVIAMRRDSLAMRRSDRRLRECFLMTEDESCTRPLVGWNHCIGDYSHAGGLSVSGSR